MAYCCRTDVPSSVSTQGGAVQAGEAQFHLAEHWCHVVPLLWMALISALSWGRLIPTVLTLSPVLHCDTGHRRNSPHPHFSKLKHHLWCHWIPIWSQRITTSVGHNCTTLSCIYTHSNNTVLCKYLSEYILVYIFLKHTVYTINCLLYELSWWVV